MKRSGVAAAVFLAAAALSASAGAKAPQPHNVLVFVADGLRADSVTAKSAPALDRIRREGVNFANPHALFPTVTTVNASAIATGHYIGDTGNFGNQLYTGFASSEVNGATTPFLESDAVLGEMNSHFGGNYLNEESLLAAARQAGFQTAALGKLGATAIQDVTVRNGSGTIVVDDAVGTAGGLALAPDIAAAMAALGLSSTAPKSAAPNTAQQRYLLDVATKIVLPKFKKTGRPFVMVFWSRDPDASQHSQKDSLGKLTPGINGPTSEAGLKDADETLARLLSALKALGLDRTTNVFVTADHGFSAIYKRSRTSVAGQHVNFPPADGDADMESAPDGADRRELPPGFLAIDLANALQLPLFDPNTQEPVDYEQGEHPSFGNGLIGESKDNPLVIVTANGGSDAIYIPGANRDLAEKVVNILIRQDYVSGIFVNDDFGAMPGTLPMSAINLRGDALTPQPSIIVSFRSFVIAGCQPELLCAAEVADTSLQTGQGMHGTFSRADTKNFMAAIGPDFRARLTDEAPVSNADLVPTLAHILRLSIPRKGRLTGRVMTEAIVRGKRIGVTRGWTVSPPAENGLKTVLNYQQVGGTRYFDAAGYPGKTVGLIVH